MNNSKHPDTHLFQAQTQKTHNPCKFPTMPRFTRFFGTRYRVDETRRPNESDTAYLDRLVRDSVHRGDDVSAFTLRFAQGVYLDLDIALLARTIARVTVTNDSGRLMQHSDRLLSAAAVNVASVIRHRPVSIERVARVSRVGDEVLDAWADLVREVDRLGWQDRRTIFGNSEDGDRRWRAGLWEKK